MDVYKRYEVLEPVSEGAVRTLKAREKSTGREVLLHLAAAANDALAHGLKSLPADKRAHVLEEGEESGTLFVVTDTALGGASFEQWVARQPDTAALGRTGQWTVTKTGMKTVGGPPPSS